MFPNLYNNTIGSFIVAKEFPLISFRLFPPPPVFLNRLSHIVHITFLLEPLRPLTTEALAKVVYAFTPIFKHFTFFNVKFSVR